MKRNGRWNIPKFHRVGLWLFRVLICGIYGFKAFDPCTGLYGVKREHLINMKLRSRGFAIEPEVSIKCGRMGLRTLDMPIRYRRRLGNSKLNAMKTGFDDMFTIAKLLLWRQERDV